MMAKLHRILLPVTFLAAILLSCSRSDAPKFASEIEKTLVKGDWQGVLDGYTDDGLHVVYQDICCLNVALAETGQLADKAFNYTQAGSLGILPEWEFDIDGARILSRVYYSMGHIALTQRMAFEGNVMSKDDNDPPLLEMLVRTNLIYGAYPVAEKYLALLGDIPQCRDFVSRYSRFLWNDEALEADPELGPRRKCIPKEDFLTTREIEEDLEDIAKSNPSFRNAIEYAGLIKLLDLDIDGFKELVDRNYGTDVLPSLPVSFKEAACILSETYPGYWKTVGVESAMWNEYRGFLSRIDGKLPVDKYKGTFWYYVARIANAGQKVTGK